MDSLPGTFRDWGLERWPMCSRSLCAEAERVLLWHHPQESPRAALLLFPLFPPSGLSTQGPQHQESMPSLFLLPPPASLMDALSSQPSWAPQYQGGSSCDLHLPCTPLPSARQPQFPVPVSAPSASRRKTLSAGPPSLCLQHQPQALTCTELQPGLLPHSSCTSAEAACPSSHSKGRDSAGNFLPSPVAQGHGQGTGKRKS